VKLTEIAVIAVIAVIAKRQTPYAIRFLIPTPVSPTDRLFFFLADISDFRPLVCDEVHSLQCG
jgi:hypothetical protein